MLLNGARLPARLDSGGNILRLEEQVRNARAISAGAGISNAMRASRILCLARVNRLAIAASEG
jgi:predicted RNA polymerase sigma factor